ncbi:MAG TPA: lipocalin-like domain-containing protein [bacterium]|nr:lipocalin-like domain-containing protein [bacterium]
MDQQPQAALDALGADTKDSIAQSLWLDRFDPARIPPDVLSKLADPKNSNRAFGQRQGYRMQQLLEHPEPFGGDNRRRYDFLMRYCEALSPHQAYAMCTVMGGDTAIGYKDMPEKANFQFPRDYQADLETQVGWYFLIGSARGKNGKEYGLEIMLFRYALLPPPMARHFGLTDEENQIVELHFAIAEAGRGHWQTVPFVVAGTTGMLEFKRNTIHMRMGKNVIGPADGAGPFPMRVAMRGVDRGEPTPVIIETELLFTSGKGVMPVGADGCLPCCAGVGTLYYAIPDLQVDLARSSLTLNGERIEFDWGRFWIEHQWADAMIPGGNPRSAVLRAASALAPKSGSQPVVGWDYFIAQFDAGYQLNFFSLHTSDYQNFYRQTGPTPPGTMTVPISGNVMDPQKGVHDVDGTLQITEWVKVESSPDRAQYFPTHTWYPNKWVFDLGAPLPADIGKFTMFPIVPKGGSTGFFAFGAQYAEGATYLRDPQGKDIGRGWAESVMYADPADNTAALVGLPRGDATTRALAKTEPSGLQKLWALIYTLWPPHARELKRLLQACIEGGAGKGYPPKAAPGTTTAAATAGKSIDAHPAG